MSEIPASEIRVAVSIDNGKHAIFFFEDFIHALDEAVKEYDEQRGTSQVSAGNNQEH
jgi:hypothetical protein